MAANARGGDYPCGGRRHSIGRRQRAAGSWRSQRATRPAIQSGGIRADGDQYDPVHRNRLPFLGATVGNAHSGTSSAAPAPSTSATCAAQPKGVSQWDPFWRVILPGTLPSIFTGAAVNHVGGRVADETISGGGTQGGGLRFFIWNSYMCGSLPQIVVGMISTGTAG